MLAGCSGAACGNCFVPPFHPAARVEDHARPGRECDAWAGPYRYARPPRFGDAPSRCDAYAVAGRHAHTESIDDADPGTGSDAQPDHDSEPRPRRYADAGTDPDTSTDAHAATDSNTTAYAYAYFNPHADTDTDANANTDTDTHANADPNPDSHGDPDADTHAGPAVMRANALTGQGVPLGTDATFAVLAGSTVTNAGPTIVTGDLGVSPGTAVTGFGPGIVTGGAIHAGDPAAAQAQVDLTTAFNNAAARANPVAVPADIGGTVITPGLSQAPVSLAITGNVTLDGQNDPNSVFIFRMASTLTTATNSSVI